MIELAVEVLKGLVKREKETKSEVMWGIQRCRIGRKLDVAASMTRQTNMIFPTVQLSWNGEDV